MNSAEKVERCEDVLTQILLFLPPKSLFKFISVSKRWGSIIKTQFFIRRYGRHCSGGRLLAYFQVTESIFFTPLPRRPINIIPTTRRNRGCARNIPRRFGFFAGSSDGLILCTPDHNAYFVMNPVTMRFVSLPLPPPCQRSNTSAGLMCEENLNELAPRYTIIRAHSDIAHSELTRGMEIHTYSSDTRRWSEKTLTAMEPFVLREQNAMVVDGVYHWRGNKDMQATELVLVYDTRSPSNSLQVIELPSLFCRIGRSNDGVLWSGTAEFVNVIKLWALPKAEEEEGPRVVREQWELLHIIELKHIFSRMDFSSWDPLILLLYRKSRLGKELFYYNVKTGFLKKVGHGGFFATGGLAYDVSPLYQSSFLSSYAL